MTWDDKVWLARWLDNAGIKAAQAPADGEEFEYFKMAYGIDDAGYGEISYEDLIEAFSILSDYQDGIYY